jgi:HK97 gp10 family phage protein
VAVRITIKTKRRWSRTNSIIKNVRSNSAQASYDFARGTAASARFRCPVDTGALKASIQNKKIGPMHHQVRVGEFYGAYVEYGTRHMAAQPYLRPAIEEQKRIFKAKMAKVFSA